MELSSEQTQEALRVDLVTGLKRSGVRGHSKAAGNWKVELLCGSLRGSHLCSVGRFIFGRQEKERREKKKKNPSLVSREHVILPCLYSFALGLPRDASSLEVYAMGDILCSCIIHHIALPYIRRAGDELHSHSSSLRAGSTQRRVSAYTNADKHAN